MVNLIEWRLVRLFVATFLVLYILERPRLENIVIKYNVSASNHLAFWSHRLALSSQDSKCAEYSPCMVAIQLWERMSEGTNGRVRLPREGEGKWVGGHLSRGYFVVSGSGSMRSRYGKGPWNSWCIYPGGNTRYWIHVEVNAITYIELSFSENGLFVAICGDGTKWWPFRY